MDIGVGLDATLNLSFDQQAELSREAAQLGYTSVWTPESTGMDSFQLCAHRWAASRQAIPEGLHTGIAVFPGNVPHPGGLRNGRRNIEPTDRRPVHHGHWLGRRLPSQNPPVYRHAPNLDFGADARLSDDGEGPGPW